MYLINLIIQNDHNEMHFVQLIVVNHLIKLVFFPFKKCYHLKSSALWLEVSETTNGFAFSGLGGKTPWVGRMTPGWRPLLANLQNWQLAFFSNRIELF